MNEIEILLQKLFEPPKKGNDHCGNPSQVLKTASKTIEMLLKASVYNAQSGKQGHTVCHILFHIQGIYNRF